MIYDQKLIFIVINSGQADLRIKKLRLFKGDVVLQEREHEDPKHQRFENSDFGLFYLANLIDVGNPRELSPSSAIVLKPGEEREISVLLHSCGTGSWVLTPTFITDSRDPIYTEAIGQMINVNFNYGKQ